MSPIFPYIPDWLDYLVGWNGGIVVGLLVGWHLRSCFRKVSPVVDPSYFKGGNL